MRAIRLLLLIPAVAALSGCVAAALPVLATTVMTGDAVRDGKVTVQKDAVAPAADAATPPAAPNYTEQFVAAAMFAADRAGTGQSVVPDPAAEDADTLVRGCSESQQPALLVDLDPGAAALRPQVATLSAPQGLAPALAVARGKGLTIAWTSVLDEAEAPLVRNALAASGLDPAGRDVLLLTRDPAESKTDRRDAALSEYCFVAMIGDQRGDFDELMDYLRDSDGPSPFDPLFGNGWFELPPPLIARADVPTTQPVAPMATPEENP
ncbi:hypothetical protein [Croceicoccus naphthovorans]|uniref:hypothetical protein n=1 Tax=Croceicoccus naphthovorans TaxID=1348774 RepID=UPI00069D445E|nr:hypothetical protein [Croceicoccus naphthovorans]MBB3992117.1 hypothetical protein [Croceicoccus naphthovorans]